MPIALVCFLGYVIEQTVKLADYFTFLYPFLIALLAGLLKEAPFFFKTP